MMCGASHSKIKTKTKDVLTYSCRFILVMVVDSSAKYAKEITKERNPKGPYAVYTCFNQVIKQVHLISTCTGTTLAKALINYIFY